LSGTGTLTVSGQATLTGTSGVQTGAGTTSAQGGLTLGATGTTTVVGLDTGRVLENAGASGKKLGNFVNLNLNPQSNGIAAAGTLRNAAGGTFDDQTASSGLTITANNFGAPDNGAAALVDNRGTWKKTGSAATSTVNTAFNNSGTVDVENGTLALSGPVSQYAGTALAGGTWIVGNGGKLTLTTGGANILTNAGGVSLVGVGSVFAPTTR
jgi:hypothetical protein